LVVPAARCYARVMRYPDGGGLTAAERARREQVRLSGSRPDRGRGQRPGGGLAVPGDEDVGEPVAARAGRGRPGGLAIEGAGRRPVQAHLGPAAGTGGRAGGGSGRAGLG